MVTDWLRNRRIFDNCCEMLNSLEGSDRNFRLCRNA